MIWLFLINGLLAFICGWISRRPNIFLVKDDEMIEMEYLYTVIDGEEYEVIAK